MQRCSAKGGVYSCIPSSTKTHHGASPPCLPRCNPDGHERGRVWSCRYRSPSGWQGADNAAFEGHHQVLAAMVFRCDCPSPPSTGNKTIRPVRFDPMRGRTRRASVAAMIATSRTLWVAAYSDTTGKKKVSGIFEREGWQDNRMPWFWLSSLHPIQTE